VLVRKRLDDTAAGAPRIEPPLGDRRERNAKAEKRLVEAATVRVVRIDEEALGGSHWRKVDRIGLEVYGSAAVVIRKGARPAT
jgi:hypothetical protein